jgi:hypothetical protein
MLVQNIQDKALCGVAIATQNNRLIMKDQYPKYSSTEVISYLDDIAASNFGRKRRAYSRIEPEEIDEDCLPKLAFIFRRGNLNPHCVRDWQFVAVLLSHFVHIKVKGEPRVWTEVNKKNLLEAVYKLKVRKSDLSVKEAIAKLVRKGQAFEKFSSNSLYIRFFEFLKELERKIKGKRATKRQIELMEVLRDTKGRSKKPAELRRKSTTS